VKKGEIQWAGFWLAGLLCLVLATLKVTQTVPWSWWRVWLPIWVMLVHTAVYLAVGFIWLTWMEGGGECRAVPESQQRYRYLFGSMVCSLICMDNVLRKMGATGETVWFWLASGTTQVIFLSGVLTVVCQFLFWATAVRRKKPRFRKH
jgi:hypothetical protein